ncbi:MAG: class I SAM-dependent RNA methyltransferase [Rhodospirillales bacterium]|nr:class I SAM-dependent RNA methyltransferase [Alphaproteobacteria bacterium]MCB9986281.1 class I SAM-dependent RNA methyltransferase [Rhodospirillales bacterium]USO07166.1 MAG: class I SAM-dependent RNA methyltransferase [Rhodospirillales bacterium]
MAGDLTIHKLGPKGDGIHESARGRIYVERALPGDVVQAKIHRGDDGILRGRIAQIIRPSEHRITPLCPFYESCGGCSAQHMEDAWYREWKQDIVREALHRQGLNPRHWRDPVFIGPGTRRRATFALFKKGKALHMGYYRRRSRQVADIPACLVTAPEIMDLRARVLPLIAPVVQEGRAVDVFIQMAGGAFDLAITGPVGRKGQPDLALREAAARLIAETPVARVSWRARERDAPELVLERDKPVAAFGALRVVLPPMAFLQPTRDGEAALTGAVMDLLPERGKFADLFSGCGTFTGPMLARGPVDAYESVDPAIRALNGARGTLPLRAIRRDLFKNPLRRDEANRYDAIVFDPPRAGCAEQARTLASGRVPVLVGVSCNPATFARDARTLVDGGYRLETVQVVDQFTWSHHVELVAQFTKK